MKMIKQIDCPVCGHNVEVFDICDHCGWQNSGLFEDEKSPQGPNKMTLKEAKEAYENGEKVL